MDEAVEPLLAGCALAANGVSPSEGSVYLANCTLAVQGVLQRFDFCAWRVPRLQEQLSHTLKQVVHEQVESVLRSVNLDEKIYAVRSHAEAKAKAKAGEEGGAAPGVHDRISDMAGMDPLALSIGIKQFYAAVLSNGLDFKFVDRLSSHVMRQQAREKVAEGLSAVYRSRPLTSVLQLRSIPAPRTLLSCLESFSNAHRLSCPRAGSCGTRCLRRGLDTRMLGPSSYTLPSRLRAC